MITFEVQNMRHVLISYADILGIPFQSHPNRRLKVADMEFVFLNFETIKNYYYYSLICKICNIQISKNNGSVLTKAAK